MKKLFLVSGGLDSVANLIKYVEAYGTEGVIVLHVEFGDAIRHFAEKQAVTSICAKYMIPSYVQRIDFVPVVDFDMLIQAALSFHYRQIPCEEIWFGFTGLGGGKPYSVLFEWAREYMTHLNSFTLGIPLKRPRLNTAIDGITRKELLEIVGEELFWSCRAPMVDGELFEPCGRCGTCREYVEEGLTHGTMHVSINSVPTRMSIHGITQPEE
ncbi:hypothetical protein NVP1188A_43 [Vibrio phage 1.188.A._10N.286.51.A6]|uniref:Uncharacterized protein n=3 Tax=Mukerjeevirus mv51A6 TaxID=2734162 RepID=A0A2I7RIY9_9CAUD|nr:QueC-like queuosine biosynthesis [Vibrio phage 1.188.A._10N.286.51.A6]AUR93611.1 hypothetical protein NVP1188A_43 [Vibrio phage 1.188.A._10N.286.51.A6]AUR93697.1 hypothetical protein NVP1188B_43 [Vibrio phage 1.188.B._10N.286.51.A6]AUR93783.1 hypothetical protein NVP1188C_43 [Vibrio phage 1.188.C._10N.286.51.A6]